MRKDLPDIWSQILLSMDLSECVKILNSIPGDSDGCPIEIGLKSMDSGSLIFHLMRSNQLQGGIIFTLHPELQSIALSMGTRISLKYSASTRKGWNISSKYYALDASLKNMMNMYMEESRTTGKESSS